MLPCFHKPDFAWAFLAIVTASQINNIVCSKSFSTNPLDVKAGAPNNNNNINNNNENFSKFFYLQVVKSHSILLGKTCNQ